MGSDKLKSRMLFPNIAVLPHPNFGVIADSQSFYNVQLFVDNAFTSQGNPIRIAILLKIYSPY